MLTRLYNAVNLPFKYTVLSLFNGFISFGEDSCKTTWF